MEDNENLNNQVNDNNVVKEEKNNNRRVGIVILIIGLVLVGLAVYKLFIEEPASSEPNSTNTPTPTPMINNEESEKYKAYDFDEVVTNMKKNLYFEYEYTSDKLPREIEVTPTADKYHIVLGSDGKITIKKGESDPISINISDIKNIDYCNDMYVRLYILLNNGDVYEYTLEDFDNGNYIPTKINEIKNAIKFVKLIWADCTECGGNTNLGIINSDNKYIELDGIGF